MQVSLWLRLHILTLSLCLGLIYWNLNSFDPIVKQTGRTTLPNFFWEYRAAGYVQTSFLSLMVLKLSLSSIRSVRSASHAIYLTLEIEIRKANLCGSIRTELEASSVTSNHYATASVDVLNRTLQRCFKLVFSCLCLLQWGLRFKRKTIARHEDLRVPYQQTQSQNKRKINSIPIVISKSDDQSALLFSLVHHQLLS